MRIFINTDDKAQCFSALVDRTNIPYVSFKEEMQLIDVSKKEEVRDMAQ